VADDEEVTITDPIFPGDAALTIRISFVLDAPEEGA
jgi:hypothetical protein